MDIDYDKIKEEVKAEVLGSLKEQQEKDEKIQAHITATDFNNMDLTTRIKLKNEYPKAYERLVK